MRAVSVVVLAPSGFGDAGRCATGLLAEMGGADEIVWVGSLPPVPAITTVVPVTDGGRGGLYRAGLDRAAHPLVAFTDSATLVEPGWRAAIDQAIAAGAMVVGGPVLPGSRPELRTLAGFVVEYGPHAAPPFSSATGDVAANNMAYDRAALEGVLGLGEPVWKSVVNARLTANGCPPVVHDQMRVVSLKHYAWSDLLGVRAAHGRHYGAQQAAGMGSGWRAVGVAKCLVLPIVAYGRLAARLVSQPALRRRFALASPMILLALTAWSAGEAVGLCTATGEPSDVI